jgi:hypothetical protein
MLRPGTEVGWAEASMLATHARAALRAAIPRRA